MSSEQICPVCKSDSFLNPNIKIFISPCFHKICEQCLYKIFARGVAPCPECQIPLRRINFITSTFEDIEVERELKIRRQLQKIYSEQLLAINEGEDCEDEEEIIKRNDWLEAFEDLVFELMELKSEARIKAKIEDSLNKHPILNIKIKKEAIEEPVEKSRFGVYEDSESEEIPKGILVPQKLFNLFDKNNQIRTGIRNETILSLILKETSKYF